MIPSNPAPGGHLAVSCPQCAEKYLVELSAAQPWGATLPCRICGGRIPLPPPSEVPPPSSQEDPASRQTSASSPMQAAPESERSNEGHDRRPPPASASAEVTCPRCRHTFDPGASGGAPRTILVVEDTEFFLRLLTDTLGQRYRVVVASTKAEALAILQAQPIDLVVVDLTLEGENDGAEVIAAAGADVPCLVFTARNEAEMWGETWSRLREMGASDLLLKGMNVEEQLLKKVQVLLASSSRVATDTIR